MSTAGEMQAFCARVINLCHGVEDADILLDLDLLRAIAAGVRKEAEGVSRMFYQPGMPVAGVESRTTPTSEGLTGPSQS